MALQLLLLSSFPQNHSSYKDAILTGNLLPTFRRSFHPTP